MVRNANKDIQVYPANVRPNPSTLVVPSSNNTIGEPYSGHSIEESSSVNKGKKKLRRIQKTFKEAWREVFPLDTTLSPSEHDLSYYAKTEGEDLTLSDYVNIEGEDSPANLESVINNTITGKDLTGNELNLHNIYEKFTRVVKS